MSSNLEKRIAALEARLAPRFITLKMPDGTTRKIPGEGHHLLQLVVAAGRSRYLRGLGKLAPESKYESELKLIGESVSDDEEGQMVQLVRIAVRSPVGDVEANILADEGDIGDGYDDE